MKKVVLGLAAAAAVLVLPGRSGGGAQSWARKLVMAAAAVLAVAPVISAAPAQADTRGCVTHREFSRIHRGDTRAHVTRVFDTRGFRDGRWVWYEKCRRNTADMAIHLTPDRQRVAQKHWNPLAGH